MEEKLCLECKKPIIGRVDKKFCDDQCRSAYNNRINSETSAIIRKINSTLKKNRQILIELCPQGKNKTKFKNLLLKGFDPKYHTNSYTTKEGAIYKFCYEYGWLTLEDENVLIVKND
jgi:hypothetical protein